MKIGALSEVHPGEARVAMTPASAAEIAKLGHQCLIQAGAGEAAGFPDEAYRAAGVEVVADAETLSILSEVIVKVRPPTEAEMARLRDGQILISFFYPGQNPALLEAAREKGATVIAMDMVPRISRAQKMDALSSMASIAGYRAVIEAGANFGRFFTGQVTAAGKVPPARVLVVGAGVAGLAAIGTAVSLGAVVQAYDVRPEVAEQIESMGASFVALDFADAPQDGAATGGYAAPASPEFHDRQIARFRELAPGIDIVITTALIPGRPAPVLWTREMVAAMRPGSVIVDLAAEQGGNCELTVPGDKIVTPNGVTIIGYTDFPSRMAAQASSLYATNLRHMLAELTPGRDGQLVLDLDDDVIRDATVVAERRILYPPPPPKLPAIAARPRPPKAREPTPEEHRAQELRRFRTQTRRQMALLGLGAVVLALVGVWAPPGLMGHLTVFALACFVGFQVIWGVSYALHTPLMAVTNAISGIVILGALLQVGSDHWLVALLAAVAVLIATINIVGGFLVTRRMLAMFQRS
jgi:NAD(P) transhydrogenase subunit alpha